MDLNKKEKKEIINNYQKKYEEAVLKEYIHYMMMYKREKALSQSVEISMRRNHNILRKETI